MECNSLFKKVTDNDWFLSYINFVEYLYSYWRTVLIAILIELGLWIDGGCSCRENKNIEWENIEVSTIALPGGKEKAVGYESSLSTGIK